jgi:hypothetical protein
VSAGRAAHVRPALPAAPSPPAARQRACKQEQPVVVGMVPAARARTGPTGARLLKQVPEPRVSAGGRRTFDRRCQPRPRPPPLAKGPASRSSRSWWGRCQGCVTAHFVSRTLLSAAAARWHGCKTISSGTVLVGRTFGVPAGRAVGRFTAPLTGWMLPNQPRRLATVPPGSCASCWPSVWNQE